MKKIKIYDILFFIAIVCVIFFAFTIYQNITYTDERCYNPETKFYEDMTDCTYDEFDGVWTCNEGEFNYCQY